MTSPVKPPRSSNVASLHDEALPEPDYDHLDLSFAAEPDEDDLKKDLKKQQSPQYILGTLVLRVVAARDLEPVRGSALGNLLNRSARDRGGRGGSANPYAMVRFAQQTQRTTEVYDTLDPIWPRGEAMYLDVSLPLAQVTHNDQDTTTSRAPPVAAAAAAPAAVDIKDSPEEEALPKPILTVALFHAMLNDMSSNNERYPTKKKSAAQTGDSNEPFLGMASIDVTPLLTGKIMTLDRWLPLSGTSNAKSRASVRLVCEYEPSDSAFRPGDVVRFTQFCDRADLYPVPPGQAYQVQEANGDDVIISYETPEGWLCTFQAHRYMFICEERHHGAMEVAQDELASIAERLGRSPLVSTVTQTVDRLPEEGLVSIGAVAVKEGATLLNRWMKGGVDLAVGDLVFATNWDGRFNQDPNESQEGPPLIPSDSHDEDIGNPLMAPAAAASSSSAVPEEHTAAEEEEEPQGEAIPGMPCCPITGEPMRNPVVAADGHTYERAAIARWLKTSDKSPLTGNVLPHKELVTNYGLLSSVQEAASARLKDDDAYQEEASAEEGETSVDFNSE